MKNIRILDCTLRDGGYINEWNFGERVIKDIINQLADAHIDIIECGFIRNVDDDPDSSVFSSMNQLSDIINPKRAKTLYAVMIEQHNYVPELISKASPNTADIIRLTFRRNEWEDAKNTLRELMEKGYKVCVQPVGTASYDALSLINLINDVNIINPYAFYLVDTLGVMYQHEMRKFFYLIDDNLSTNIALGFHSHNNLQLSFANAQELIRLNRDRSIIIDSSCYGMGRGVGNLATELILDYINTNLEQRYSLTPILNIVDKHLMPIYSQQRWGYDLPYFLSAKFKCHPNYAAHLIRKETLGIERIEKVLSLIPVGKRTEYDAQLVENLYFDLQTYSIVDKDAYTRVVGWFDNKEVVIIGPGKSIMSHKTVIENRAQGKIVISTNFVPANYSVDALFISNEKRLNVLESKQLDMILATSNLKDRVDNALYFDYSSLLGEGDASDNAGAMLIRLLKKSGVKKIYLAGFDGFEVDSTSNFAVEAFMISLDYETAQKKNNDISKQLSLALEGVEYEFITPTKYQINSI